MAQTMKSKSSCYCINLRRAAGVLSDLYDRHLAPLGISVTQYSLLRNLSQLERCTVSELASRMGLERTTLVRTLKPLFASGLVMDSSSAGQRNRCLQLTEKGNALLEKGIPLWEAAQDDIRQRIGPDDANTLLRILQRITE